MPKKPYKPPVLTWEELQELMVDIPPEGFRCVRRIITPELAKRILDELNPHNRNPRDPKIREFALALSSGRYKLNGQSPIFSDKLRLLDGQNRLYACVRSGVPLDTLIVFGIDDDAFDTIDSGKPRDHADVLKLLGAKEPRHTANGVKWAQWFETGQVKARPGIIPQELGELYLEKHKGVEDFVPEAKKIARANGQSVGMVAGFLYTATKIDGDMAADFSEAWKTGTRPPVFAGITTMQTTLTEMRNKGQLGGHRHEVTRAAMTVNAWNAAMRGNPRGTPIRWDYAAPFPQFRGKDGKPTWPSDKDDQ
jgi:hypothetical protein